MHMEFGEESHGVKNKTWKDNMTLDLTKNGCENGTWMETVQDYATSSADQMSESFFFFLTGLGNSQLSQRLMPSEQGSKHNII